VNDKAWQASPILGVPNVRQAAEYYRDVLGSSSSLTVCFNLPPMSQGVSTRS